MHQKLFAMLSSFSLATSAMLFCQPSFAWTLTPMKFEKTLKPGESFTDVLVIDNSGASDSKRYEIKIVDWSLDEKGDLQYMEPGQIQESFAKGIVCTPMQFKCAPGERKLVRYTLTLPENATSGEHTVGIQALEVVIPSKDLSTGRINVGVSVKCGFLCAMSIRVPSVEEKAVEPISMEVKPAAKDHPALVNLLVENLGNVRVRPLWSFKIMDAQGKTMFEEAPSDYLILRQKKRAIACQIKQNLPPGKYRVVGKLDQGVAFPVQELEKDFEVVDGQNLISNLAK